MKDKNIININNPELDFNMDNFQKELEEENKFWIKLVDTIPAKLYFEQDIQEKITADKHFAMDKAAAAIKRKSNNFELSAKAKHKRSRLDPLQLKTVSQIHEELNSMKKEKKKKQKGSLIPSASLTRAANIEELQNRLHEKIKILQEQRKACRHDPEARKKLKTKIKKSKKEKNKSNIIKTQEPVRPTKKPDVDPSSNKPVFNKESNIIFSKFNFNEEGSEDVKKSEYTGKKTKALLKKAEMKKEKIQTLKQEDPEKAKLLEEKEKWKKAVQKSAGIKVKDDPKLLKRSLKSEEKRKKKSAKHWKERIEDAEKRKKAQQDKRNKNIKMRKKEKLDHKIKLAKKKGRVIPGF